MPNPRLNEKNACPIAPIITDELILEKSGVKRNFNPSTAPGIISEFMQKIMAQGGLVEYTKEKLK